MTMVSSPNVRQLPFHEKHIALGGKMGQFGDWEVPLYFAGILEEHEGVRSRAGLFDVSHMGKFVFKGPGTDTFLNSFLPRNILAMKEGQALYMPLLNQAGGFIDDIIVYKVTPAHFFMIVNAGNVSKDYAWIEKQVPAGISFKDETPNLGLIALQGPSSFSILEKILGTSDFSALKNYSFRLWEDGMIARTGYTGEAGFEIMANFEVLGKLWDSILKEGAVPAGFGARDTLRLEASMLLYGHDMDENATPLEAGIEWALDWSKPQFTGRAALESQKKNGITRKLAGFEMTGRGIPRQGHEIQKDGKVIGQVTSGSFSPTLKKNIGMGYVEIFSAEPGREIDVMVRGSAVKARIVPMPFYKRLKKN